MNQSSGSVRVTILGDEYLIKGDVDIETTKQVAEYVNGKMEEIQAGVASRDRVKIAVLSAMNIAGELLESRKNCDEHKAKLDAFEEKAETLARKIDDNVCT
jgi:cell division protein ZapA